MSELDRAVLRHVEQRPASPLVLIPTSSHTVDFAAAQLCSLRTVGWQPAALVVCWDRDACSVLRDAHLPAVLEEVGGGGRGTDKGKGAGGFHFEGPHKLGRKAHPYIPTGVFHHAGRALQWLKFYLLHRVSAALAGTRVPLLVVDADILWLRPAAAALSAACAGGPGLDVLAMADGGISSEYAASANAGAILSCDTSAARAFWRDANPHPNPDPSPHPHPHPHPHPNPDPNQVWPRDLVSARHAHRGVEAVDEALTRTRTRTLTLTLTLT